MSNYNSTLQSNNTDLQSILDSINALPDAGGEQATPVISVNSTNGLITATAGAKTSTYQLAFQPAKTITPSTASQIAVSSGYYTGGNITVKGDPNLVASNIKSGVSIFGVNGTLVDGGGGSGEQVEWSENEDAIISRTLSSYTNDRVTTIGYNAFASCRSLTSVSFPACTTIGYNAFASCRSLTSVNFPVCTTISREAFASCRSLTSVSFPACTTIGYNAFRYCYNLKSLYLTGSSLCTLADSNAFTSTPIGGYSTSEGTYGSIYVPASLLTSYQTATNWTYFSSRFVGVDIDNNIITFTIDRTVYQAEEGMTWAEWCDSEYNTDNQFFIGSNDVVKFSNNQGWYDEVHQNNIPVFSNNEIIQDAAYILIAPGAGA